VPEPGKPAPLPRTPLLLGVCALTSLTHLTHASLIPGCASCGNGPSVLSHSCHAGLCRLPERQETLGEQEQSARLRHIFRSYGMVVSFLAHSVAGEAPLISSRALLVTWDILSF